jgi:predicted permease
MTEIDTSEKSIKVMPVLTGVFVAMVGAMISSVVLLPFVVLGSFITAHTAPYKYREHAWWVGVDVTILSLIAWPIVLFRSVALGFTWQDVIFLAEIVLIIPAAYLGTILAKKYNKKKSA